mmetsp:Transcript_64097/g.139436  ORF Transcript_64097/g.139436 Transcript_64097/m.139436 type:complete len:235 (-) Transcript_64097:128-832(-)
MSPESSGSASGPHCERFLREHRRSFLRRSNEIFLSNYVEEVEARWALRRWAREHEATTGSEQESTAHGQALQEGQSDAPTPRPTSLWEERAEQSEERTQLKPGLHSEMDLATLDKEDAVPEEEEEAISMSDGSGTEELDFLLQNLSSGLQNARAVTEKSRPDTMASSFTCGSEPREPPAEAHSAHSSQEMVDDAIVTELLDLQRSLLAESQRRQELLDTLMGTNRIHQEEEGYG